MNFIIFFLPFLGLNDQNKCQEIEYHHNHIYLAARCFFLFASKTIQKSRSVLPGKPRLFGLFWKGKGKTSYSRIND